MRIVFNRFCFYWYGCGEFDYVIYYWIVFVFLCFVEICSVFVKFSEIVVKNFEYWVKYYEYGLCYFEVLIDDLFDSVMIYYKIFGLLK